MPQEECPICCEEKEEKELVMFPCCAKLICKSCGAKQQRANGKGECPFCRQRIPKTDAELARAYTRRAEQGDATNQGVAEAQNNPRVIAQANYARWQPAC